MRKVWTFRDYCRDCEHEVTSHFIYTDFKVGHKDITDRIYLLEPIPCLGTQEGFADYIENHYYDGKSNCKCKGFAPADNLEYLEWKSSLSNGK